MDAIWKQTYDALTQLRKEIADGTDAGTRHFSDEKRLDLLRAVDAVRNDAPSCARLGRLILKHS